MYYCTLVYQIEQPILNLRILIFFFTNPFVKRIQNSQSDPVNSKMKIRNIPSAHVMFFYNQNQDRRIRGTRGPNFGRSGVADFAHHIRGRSQTMLTSFGLFLTIYPPTLKFMFSKKATKIDQIFTGDLTLCSKCQIDGEDFVNFCGLLRKHELYKLSE